MPPKKKIFTNHLAPTTFIIDNGGDTIKAGFAREEPSYSNCSVIPNTIAYSARDKRSYVGSQLEKCMDFGELGFRRPVQKGFVVNWESEKAIWEEEFFDEGAAMKVRPFFFSKSHL
jgi:actin-related protein 6